MIRSDSELEAGNRCRSKRADAFRICFQEEKQSAFKMVYALGTESGLT